MTIGTLRKLIWIIRDNRAVKKIDRVEVLTLLGHTDQLIKLKSDADKNL